MNPGFIAYIAITLTAILIWSGWRDLVSGGFTDRGASLFLLVWVFGSFLGWKTGNASGTLVYAALFMVIVSVLCSRQLRLNERLSLFSYGLLLGAVCSLMELISMIDPFMFAVHPLLHPSVIAAALAVIYSRQGKIQLALVSLALLSKDAYLALLYQEHTAPVFGSRSFQDEWWITSAISRAAAVSYALIGTYFFGALRKLFWQIRPRK